MPGVRTQTIEKLLRKTQITPDDDDYEIVLDKLRVEQEKLVEEISNN